MSKKNELYAGLHTEADRRTDFMERASDLIAFKKMAGFKEAEDKEAGLISSLANKVYKPIAEGAKKQVKGFQKGYATAAKDKPGFKESFTAGRLRGAQARSRFNKKLKLAEEMPKEASAMQVAKTMATHGLGGAALGGAAGAATAKPGENRLRRAAIGAGIGAGVGGVGGLGKGVLKHRAANRGAAKLQASNAERAAKAVEEKEWATTIQKAKQKADKGISNRINAQSSIAGAQQAGLKVPQSVIDDAARDAGGIIPAKFFGQKGVRVKLAQQRNQEKVAKIFGANPAPFIGGSRGDIPSEDRIEAFKDYAKVKSTESPTSIPAALGGGAAIGGGIGGLAGLMSRGGGKGPGLAGLAVGGALGALTGLAMRSADKGEISSTQRAMAGGDKGMRRATFDHMDQLSRNRDFSKSMTAERRHQQHMSKLAKAYLPANPTYADSSLNAQLGELSAMKTAEDGTTIDMSDLRGRAADKYPVSEVPSLSDEALSALEVVRKQIRDAKRAKADLLGGKKPRKVKSPLPVPTDLHKLAFNPKALPIIGGAALTLGIANYAASRPKASLGGKSSAEHGLQADVSANKSSATDDDGLPTRVRHRMKEFQSGLATDFRKSPLAAAGLGALVGGGIGSQLAKVLGAR